MTAINRLIVATYTVFESKYGTRTYDCYYVFDVITGCVHACINCFVHIIMYSYYFLSGLGPSVQKYLWWKKYVTVLQMVRLSVLYNTYFIIFKPPCRIGTIVLVVISCTYVLFHLCTNATEGSGYRIRQNFQVGKLSRFSWFFTQQRMFYDK